MRYRSGCVNGGSGGTGRTRSSKTWEETESECLESWWVSIERWGRADTKYYLDGNRQSLSSRNKRKVLFNMLLHIFDVLGTVEYAVAGVRRMFHGWMSGGAVAANSRELTPSNWSRRCE